MTNNLQQIKNLLDQSSLSTADQDNLIVLFSLSPDEQLAPVVELFSQDPSWIEKTNINYKKKKEAVETTNNYLWQDIIKEESVWLKEA